MKSAGPAIAALLLVVATLTLVYVLSVGPAIWLHSRGMLNENVAKAVYAPLIWASSSTEVIETPLTWYAELWDPGQAPSPPPASVPPAPVAPVAVPAPAPSVPTIASPPLAP